MTKVKFCASVLAMNEDLSINCNLPKDYALLNPFIENPETKLVMTEFYEKFYNDCQKRKLILGINPGRFGAGLTGVPFTDTKHLKSSCEIEMHSAQSHETSGMFVYDLIEAFGGVESFYKAFFIQNAFPLAIVRKTAADKWVNANYYDNSKLVEATKDEIILHLQRLVALGVDTSVAFVLGKKNFRFINKINESEQLFERLEVMDHPRYIQQYKTKEKPFFIQRYLKLLKDE